MTLNRSLRKKCKKSENKNLSLILCNGIKNIAYQNITINAMHKYRLLKLVGNENEQNKR